MTAIIIEDEALAARELESILKKLAPEIEIVARGDLRVRAADTDDRDSRIAEHVGACNG